jgi:hypothetical protein
MFSACYITHQDRGTCYMNITLPLPGGALHSVLRGTPPEGPGALGPVRLSTEPSGREGGHEGIWLRLGPFPVRVPLHETVVAWPASASREETGFDFEGDPGAVMVARQRFPLLGIVCLELQYVLVPARA